jgi:hypothetical protein
MNAAWAEDVATRTATVTMAIDTARANILQAKLVKLDALDHQEKEIRWSITSVYNYQWQHELTEAMDAARAEADAIWDARTAELLAALDAAAARWAAHVDLEQSFLDANTAEETMRCDDARASQRAFFEAYVDGARNRFAAWADNERTELEAFIGDCEDAW